MIRCIRRLFLPSSVRRSLANIEKQIEAASTNDKPDYSINGQSVFHSRHLLQLTISRSLLLGEMNVVEVPDNHAKELALMEQHAAFAQQYRDVQGLGRPQIPEPNKTSVFAEGS